jgi:ABC-2 type transport system ATP-binding protein
VIAKTNLLEVDKLTYFYDELQALNKVSFNLKAGQILALLGPNGSGKSTLLRCLAGLEYPFLGKILLEGHNSRLAPKEFHRRVGFLPDIFGLQCELTVWQSIAWAALANKIDRLEVNNKVSQLAEELGLSSKINSPVNELSRGMKQRVGIGQVLIKNPSLVLLDEPASGLDPDSRRNLSLLIKYFKSRGTTFIVSTHILDEVDQYATDVLILKEGSIVNPTTSYEFRKAEQTIHIETLEGEISRVYEFFNKQGLEISCNYKQNQVAISFANKEPEELYNLLKSLIYDGCKIIRFETRNSKLNDIYFDIVESL